MKNKQSTIKSSRFEESSDWALL